MEVKSLRWRSTLLEGDAEESALHFRTHRDGQPELTSIDLESGFAQPSDWFDDDRMLASWRPDHDAESDIVIIDRRTGTIEPVLSGEWAEGEATVSPSGRWIAHETMQGGARRLVVRSFPELDPEVEVTRDHRRREWSTWFSIGPFWDHGQDAIYYWEDGAVWRASVTDGPSGPRLIDRTREVTLDNDDQLFGVHPDGRALVGLFYEEDELAPPPRLMLVTDLASELRAPDDGDR